MITKLVFNLLGLGIRLCLEVLLLVFILNCMVRMIPPFIRKFLKKSFLKLCKDVLKPSAICTIGLFRKTFKETSITKAEKAGAFNKQYENSNVISLDSRRKKVKGN